MNIGKLLRSLNGAYVVRRQALVEFIRITVMHILNIHAEYRFEAGPNYCLQRVPIPAFTGKKIYLVFFIKTTNGKKEVGSRNKLGAMPYLSRAGTQRL